MHNVEVYMVWADVSGINQLALNLDIGVDKPGWCLSGTPSLETQLCR
jgi:hypothetical protein